IGDKWIFKICKCSECTDGVRKIRRKIGLMSQSSNPRFVVYSGLLLLCSRHCSYRRARTLRIFGILCRRQTSGCLVSKITIQYEEGGLVFGRILVLMSRL